MRTMTSDAGANAFDPPLGAALVAEPAQGVPPALNPVPAWTGVLREQLGAVRLALRYEARVAAAIMALLSALLLLTDDGGIWLDPQMGVPVALIALLIPMAVWKGEGPGERGYHRSMPVEPTAHAVIRTGAGLAWSLAAMTASFAWLGLLTVVTGGHVDPVELWRWAAPFAGATVLYLLGSALTLVTSHPWRWLGGSVVGFLFLDSFRDVNVLRPLGNFVDELLAGRYGIYTLVNGGHNRYHTLFDPDVWLASVAIWLPVAVGAFLVAAYHQPES